MNYERLRTFFICMKYPQSIPKVSHLLTLGCSDGKIFLPVHSCLSIDHNEPAEMQIDIEQILITEAYYILEEIKKEPVTVGLIVLNMVIFFLTEITGGSQDTAHMLRCGASYVPAIVEDGEIYRIFTCMFLHFGMSHLLNNMLILFVMGQRLEPVLGKIRMLAVYLLGGVGGNLVSLYFSLQKQDYAVSAGASGAVFAVLGAMIYVLLRHRGRLQDLTVRGMLFMAALSLYYGFTSAGVDNAAHVGGLICGLILALLLYHPEKS